MATLLRTLGYPLAKWSFAFHGKGQGSLLSVPGIDYSQVELELVAEPVGSIRNFEKVLKSEEEKTPVTSEGGHNPE